MQLPTAQEINPIPEDLDGQAAVRNFLGKTPEQISRECRYYGMTYQEDLMFMGATAFCFYFPAAVDDVVAPASRGDCDVVSSLCGVIEYRLKFDSQGIQAARPAILRFVDHVTTNYLDYEFDPKIQRNVLSRLKALRMKICADER